MLGFSPGGTLFAGKFHKKIPVVLFIPLSEANKYTISITESPAEEPVEIQNHLVETADNVVL